MSWWAHLIDDRGHTEGDWNYTHNTSEMISDVLRTAGERLDRTKYESWYDRLNGMTGVEGKAYLARIIEGLESDPKKYRAMNPSNGWGTYDQLLGILREMRDSVPDWPCVWEATG